MRAIALGVNRRLARQDQPLSFRRSRCRPAPDAASTPPTCKRARTAECDIFDKKPDENVSRGTADSNPSDGKELTKACTAGGVLVVNLVPVSSGEASLWRVELYAVPSEAVARTDARVLEGFPSARISPPDTLVTPHAMLVKRRIADDWSQYRAPCLTSSDSQSSALFRLGALDRVFCTVGASAPQ